MNLTDNDSDLVDWLNHQMDDSEYNNASDEREGIKLIPLEELAFQIYYKMGEELPDIVKDICVKYFSDKKLSEKQHAVLINFYLGV